MFFFDCWKSYDDIIPNLFIDTYEDYNKHYKNKVSLQKYSEIRQRLQQKNQEKELIHKWNNILPPEKFDQMTNDMIKHIVNNYNFYGHILFEFDISQFTNEEIPHFIGKKIIKKLKDELLNYDINFRCVYLVDELDKHQNQHIIVLTNDPMYGF